MLLGLQILGQQRVSVCVFLFILCIKDRKKTVILVYACVVQGRR